MSKQNIYNKLMAEIGNKYGVCGLMGNIRAESNFVSNNAQNSYMTKMGMTDATYTAQVDNGTYKNFASDRVGYGLCQWTSAGRKAGLLDYAKRGGVSIADENMQIAYLLHELNTSYKTVMQTLKLATSVKEASDCVVTKFERPADQSSSALGKRQKYGEEVYEEFFGKAEPEMGNRKIIVIDAGHGMKTSGKRCLKSIDPNQTREWWLNDRIADKLESMLSAYNCDIIRADDTTGAKDVPLNDRTSKANAAKADVYLSIHHNAGINGKTGGGVVVYYYSTLNARAEQAQRLYNSVIAYNGLVGNRSSKVVKNSLYVLRKTNMPAFLVENGFMDSQDDTPVILREDFADKTAQGLLAWLVSEFSLESADGTNNKPVAPQPSITDEYDIKDFVKDIQKAIGAKVDGKAGTETISKTVTVSASVNRKHAVVKPIQKRLNEIGFNCGTADGIAGPKFTTAVKAFQKANGCASDGEITAGQKTWRKLLGMN